MRSMRRLLPAMRYVAPAALILLTACAQKTSAPLEHARAWSARDRDCLARAMYFESNRSSEEGMLAVGTVVMNRLESGLYHTTVCGVVGQRGQFAAGVLKKPMKAQERARAEHIAARVLVGERHPGAGRAMFFHKAGLKFPYRNMHYVLVAGGNAFYEKRSRRRS